MMVFYVLLYYVWRKRYEIKGRAGLIAAVYGLAAARVILCMMPQNQWMSASAPLSWGIYRNIPSPSWAFSSSCSFTAALRSAAKAPSAGCG